jgi:hypothetical protein
MLAGEVLDEKHLNEIVESQNVASILWGKLRLDDRGPAAAEDPPAQPTRRHTGQS